MKNSCGFERLTVCYITYIGIDIDQAYAATRNTTHEKSSRSRVVDARSALTSPFCGLMFYLNFSTDLSLFRCCAL